MIYAVSVIKTGVLSSLSVSCLLQLGVLVLCVVGYLDGPFFMGSNLSFLIGTDCIRTNAWKQ